MNTRRFATLMGAGAMALAAIAPWQTAQATNGMVPSGFGTYSKGMAGAGAAMSLDAQTAAINPGAIVGVGDRFDVGVEFFSPLRDFEVTGGGTPLTPGETQSRSDLFLVPDLGANWMIDDKSAIAFTLTGAGGMNTDYNASVFAGFAAPGTTSAVTGIDLAQVFLALTYAREIIPNHSFGIAPVIAAQRFRAEGLEPFKGVSNASNHVTGNGYDYAGGYGFRAGYQGRFFDRLNVGASYQSRMYMTEFTKYRGLFAEDGDFDMAAISTVGLSFDVTPSLTLAFDWQHIFYNDIRAIANTAGVGLTVLPSYRRMGLEDGIGFGWEDMDVFKVGVQWRAMDNLTLRTGFSRTKDDTFDGTEVLFNTLAPGVIRNHFAVGGTYRINQNHEINFAYTRAFSDSVTGTDPNAPGQVIKLRMDQHDGVISYTYRW